MTEKRFTDVEVDKYYGLICMNYDGQFHSYSEQSLEDLLNNLHEENEQLKKELQRIYDIATLDKAITIIENRYDKYLEDKDVDCIPCKRKAYIECMELLDDFRDDLRNGDEHL